MVLSFCFGVTFHLFFESKYISSDKDWQYGIGCVLTIHLTAYSPLGSGDRPTAQRDGLPVLLQNEVVEKIAREKNVTPAQILISFQLSRGISVIPKSVNPRRIRENFEAGRVVLSEEEIKQLEDLDAGMRYLNGGVWVKKGSPYTLQSLWEE